MPLRPLLHLSARNETPALVASSPSPLLEEKRHTLRIALCPDAVHPFPLHWSRQRPGFASNDHPMDSAQVKRTKILQKRLDAQESHMGRDVAQVADARQAVLAVLNRHAKPYVLVSVAPIRRQAIGDIRSPLRKKLPVNVGRLSDQAPKPSALAVGRILVCPIAHGPAEYAPAFSAGFCLFLPALWLAPVVAAHGARCLASAPMIAACAPIQNLGVAMVTSRRDLRAPPPWVERAVCPCNFCFFCHASLLSAARLPWSLS